MAEVIMTDSTWTEEIFEKISRLTELPKQSKRSVSKKFISRDDEWSRKSGDNDKSTKRF